MAQVDTTDIAENLVERVRSYLADARELVPFAALLFAPTKATTFLKRDCEPSSSKILLRTIPENAMKTIYFSTRFAWTLALHGIAQYVPYLTGLSILCRVL